MATTKEQKQAIEQQKLVQGCLNGLSQLKSYASKDGKRKDKVKKEQEDK